MRTEPISVSDLLNEVIEETGYVAELEAEDTDEARARIENIDELISKVAAYEEGEEHPTLSGFLEEVALVADIDSLEEGSDYVVLMTLHSAKGLEFPKVYLAGMEDGLFPSYMSIMSDDPVTELEEERRLAYVGITRAMKEISISGIPLCKRSSVRAFKWRNPPAVFFAGAGGAAERPVPEAEASHRAPAAIGAEYAGKGVFFRQYGKNQPFLQCGGPGFPYKIRRGDCNRNHRRRQGF